MKRSLDIEKGKLSMDKGEKILRMIEEKSTRVFLPIVGREKGRLLEQLVAKEQPKNILEIGTLVGYSAILMARHLEKGRITCIEISPKFAKIARDNIKEAGFDNVTVLEGDALDVIPKLKENFDFVFIDAAKEEYLTYLELLEKNKNIGKGTVIVADNVKIFKNAVRGYLAHMRNSNLYKSSYNDFGEDGMEESVRL